MKKVIKLLAVIVGLFLPGLAYLQYHQIANINWNKLQTISEDAIATLSNAIIQIQSISINSIDGHAIAATASSSLAMTSFGIPLTGSMSAGFTIGFIKGWFYTIARNHSYFSYLLIRTWVYKEYTEDNKERKV